MLITMDNNDCQSELPCMGICQAERGSSEIYDEKDAGANGS